MEKWTIRPEPSAMDPNRHLLLVRGKMKDITALLKKLGSVCGRPSATTTPEGFNFKLYLHGVTAAGMERVNSVLSELGHKGAPREEPAAEPQPLPAPLPPIPPLTRPADPAPAAAPPAPASVKPSAKPPPEAPAQAGPGTAGPERAPVPEPAAAARGETDAAFAPPPALISTRPLWGLDQEVDPQRSFETLMVGPYNRFAHAAATSIVSSPGTMYNPLFLYGAAGTGKTHMVHAIAGGLAKAMPQRGAVIVTSGPALSWAVNAALAEGKLAALEARAAAARALIVDDVHLLALTEQSRPVFAKMFSSFYGRSLQIVLSALYPPKALAALEEALKISFSKGWAVDLKSPAAQVQVEVAQGFFDRGGFNIPRDDVQRLLEKIGPGGAGDAGRWCRRMLTLARLAQFGGQVPRADQLLPTLFGAETSSGGPSASELEASASFAPPAAGLDAPALALWLPKGQERLRGWVLSRFCQTAQALPRQRTFRHVAGGSYDASQPFGAPFQIGEGCVAAGARAALIVGPPADSALAARAGEFIHAVNHVLEGLGVLPAWISHAGVASPSPYLRAQLDFLPPAV